MFKISKNLTLAACLLFAFNAFGEVNLDKKYICSLLPSLSNAFPIGTVTRELSMRDIANHGILLEKGFIDFYGPLNINDEHRPNSGAVILATDLSSPREIHASVFISEITDKTLKLDVIIIHTAQAFERETGQHVFIVRNNPLPEAYKFSCTSI